MSRGPAFSEDLRALVDAQIDELLRERARALEESVPLLDEIRRVVSSGGKRLRPAFCYWGYRAAGGDDREAIVGVASAFELLHTFAIVHDDIMDRAAHRRGQPTTVASLGLDRALLVGDLALVLADAAFWAAAFPADLLARAFAEFTVMREQVIAGQYLDIEAHGRNVNEDDARRIAVLKSGSYSVEHPLLIGAQLADASDELLQGLSAFGRPLGEAFQLRDDLLGVFGDSSSTGKPADSDIREGKRNVLFAKTLHALHGDDRSFFETRWGAGTDLSEDEVARLRALMASSGAVEATEALVMELADEARSCLARVDVPEAERAALEGLMEDAVTRSA